MSIIGKQKGRSITRIQFNNILKKFLVFLKKELHLRYDIPIILMDDVEFSKNHKTFGMMMDDKILISIVNRHPVDILRTVAHEYVHHKQNSDGKRLNGNAGSVTENQANAKAGEIMRKYGKLHPELFNFSFIR